MPAANIAYLRAHGPCVKAALPGRPTVAQRREGLSLFRVSGARARSANAERLTPICYLPEHEKTAVIRAFCDAHPTFMAAKTKAAFVRIMGQHGRSWRDAASRVADELDLALHSVPSGSYADREGGSCPVCEAQIEKRLPYHLRADCPKT